MNNVVNTELKAYISYSRGDDISTITALLKEHGVSVYDSNISLEIRDSVQVTMINAIKECDFVVFIYSTANAYIGFEAGVAVASDIPVFAIIDPRTDDPYFLYDSTWVRSLPNDRETIKFSFDIFIKGVQYQAKRLTKSKGKESGKIGGEPLAKGFSRKNSDYEFNGVETMNYFLMQAMSAYKINVVKNPADQRGGEYPADFAIWSDPLQGILVNPIQIESKKGLTPSIVDTLYDTISQHDKPNLGSWIIFYDEISQGLKEKLRQSPKTLFIDINQFAAKLDTLSFNDAIKQLRNELVHKI